MSDHGAARSGGAARRAAATQVAVAADVLDGDGPAALADDVAHHLERVLRLRDGEAVVLTDGCGRWRLAHAERHGATLTLHPSSPVAIEPAVDPPLVIAAAMPKGDRLEWMVQKVTELGARRIVLLHADRSVVRWKPTRVDHQLARLQRVADEATRQSRRVWATEVSAPAAAADVLPGAVVAEPGGRALAAGDRTIAIGPEGGWSSAELTVAGDHVDLGDGVLRTETAAIAAIALAAALRRGR